MSRIFLAHASEDKPMVRQLYDQLKERGFDPWLDAVDLMPGQSWREQIPRAIKTAAVCLACLSKRSVEKKSYVQREFRYALSAYADRPPGTIYLIPVRLDDCEVPDLRIPDLELKLRSIHWVDLFEDSGFEKLVLAIEHSIETSRKPPQNLSVAARQERLEWKNLPGYNFRSVDQPWCPEMVSIPAGFFLMGSSENDSNASPAETPQHAVKITQPFAIGKYPVTFEEYDYFCGDTERQKADDQGWGRDRRPVIDISWDDALAYCNWLSGQSGHSYRLPSEAEWEFVCRASTTTQYAFGNEITENQANFGDPSRGRTVQVGSYPANAWGIHDMHGNVWEWVKDCWNKNYQDAPVDGSAWQTGDELIRVIRGGSWFDEIQSLRSATRNTSTIESRDITIGFRAAMTLR